jgi:hypothetical protein
VDCDWGDLSSFAENSGGVWGTFLNELAMALNSPSGCIGCAYLQFEVVSFLIFGR